MTRDMLRIMAQENLMCSSRPTFVLFFLKKKKVVQGRGEERGRAGGRGRRRGVEEGEMWEVGEVRRRSRRRKKGYVFLVASTVEICDVLDIV